MGVVPVWGTCVGRVWVVFGTCVGRVGDVWGTCVERVWDVYVFAFACVYGWRCPAATSLGTRKVRLFSNVIFHDVRTDIHCPVAPEEIHRSTVLSGCGRSR